MLMLLFTIVYFVILFFLLDLVFRNASISVFTNILILVCWIIAFILSVGLAEYTEKKIKKLIKIIKIKNK